MKSEKKYVTIDIKKYPKLDIKFERAYGRFRIKINGLIHLSLPYQETDTKIVVHAYYIGNKKFCNIDYHLPSGQVIETGYTREDMFQQILKLLEENDII